MKSCPGDNRETSLTASFFALGREIPIHISVNSNFVILIFTMLVIGPEEEVDLREILINTDLIDLLPRFLSK